VESRPDFTILYYVRSAGQMKGLVWKDKGQNNDKITSGESCTPSNLSLPREQYSTDYLIRLRRPKKTPWTSVNSEKPDNRACRTVARALSHHCCAIKRTRKRLFASSKGLLGRQTAPTTLLLEYRLFSVPHYAAFTQRSAPFIAKPGPRNRFPSSGQSSYIVRAREKNWINFNDETVFASNCCPS
jgi:hypothetical protein